MKNKLIAMLALSAITEAAWSIDRNDFENDIRDRSIQLSDAIKLDKLDLNGINFNHEVKRSSNLFVQIFDKATDDFNKALDAILMANTDDSADLPTNGGYTNSCHCHCHSSRNWR